MKELLKSVESLTAEELARSYENFPKFNSPHEGYGVIKEEVEEHEDDTKEVHDHFEIMWCHIKHNDNQRALEFAARLRESATHAAGEAIQVAAMAQKYIDSLGSDVS